MNIITWLLVVAFISWIVSIFLGSYDQRDMFRNIAVGIVGSVLAGWLFGGVATISQGGLGIQLIVVSLLGAIVSIAALKLLRRV